MGASRMVQVHRRLDYLVSTDAFREMPVRTMARLISWLGYRLLNRSPRFQLSEGVYLEVDPVIGHSGAASAYVLRDWAEPELRFLGLFLPDGGTFIDCGANIGAYTTKAARLVGPAGRVVAIEPGDASYRCLARNIALNRPTNVTLVKKAIAETEGTSRLYHSDGGPASFSLIEQEGVGFEEVATTTIDRIVDSAGLARVDCIKIDVEGIELPALRGAAQTLKAFRPVVIFEITSPGARRVGSSFEGIRGFLSSLGYHFVYLEGDRLARLPTNPATRRAAGSPNCVAIHESLVEQFVINEGRQTDVDGSALRRCQAFAGASEATAGSVPQAAEVGTRERNPLGKLTRRAREALRRWPTLYGAGSRLYHWAIFALEFGLIRRRHARVRFFVPRLSTRRKLRDMGFQSQYGQEYFLLASDLVTAGRRILHRRWLQSSGQSLQQLLPGEESRLPWHRCRCAGCLRALGARAAGHAIRARVPVLCARRGRLQRGQRRCLLGFDAVRSDRKH